MTMKNMIGWYTDNALSKTVIDSIPDIQRKHISEFVPYGCPHIFYGILRGSGRAIHALQYNKTDYYYIDNGYFDALYIDKNKYKDMSGKFRVVKNGMHEVYCGSGEKSNVKKALVIPPSPYSANFYDTTPEDWMNDCIGMCKSSKYDIKIRHKTELRPIEHDISWCDGVLSFNSMAVIKAVEMGRAVMDTHGIFRKQGFHKYSFEDLRDFYEPKQFTLEEFRSGKWCPA